MSTDTGYLMEDPREARRLREKVNPEVWVEKWIDPHLSAGMNVVDVGCGPGVIARTVAEQRAGITITGVDIGPARVREARATIGDRGTAVLGDVVGLNFPDDRFDLAYSRLLLQFVPNPAEAISELMRVTRPGGRVVLYELDGQLVWHHPQDEQLETLLARLLAGTAKQGFDWTVGRKLYNLAFCCGLDAIEVGLEPYHLISGKIDDRQREQWALKFDVAFPTAAEALGGAEVAREFFDRFMAYMERADTLTYSVAFCVSGTVPDQREKM